jgi:transcription antitermination factor NusG
MDRWRVGHNMPTLPYQSDIYPDTLLESPPANARWWAAYTHPRREKVLLRCLRQFTVPHYGPLIKKTSRSRRHVRTAYLPVFPGYVFVCGNDQQRIAALKTRQVVRIMEVPNEAELLFDLRQVHRLIASGAPLTPEARLEPGMKVRIRSGPFEGIEGTVTERRGKDTLFVAVHFLQQGVSVALGDYETEKIE